MVLFLLRVRLYLQRNETSVKKERCSRENPEPSPRAKGMGRCLIPLLPNFNAKLFLSASKTHSLALTERRWTGRAKPPICTGFTLLLLYVRKNLLLNPLQLKPWRPEHKHTHLTSHGRAVLPHTHPTRNSAQERARQTFLQQFDLCVNTNTAICSL